MLYFTKLLLKEAKGVKDDYWNLVPIHSQPNTMWYLVYTQAPSTDRQVITVVPQCYHWLLFLLLLHMPIYSAKFSTDNAFFLALKATELQQEMHGYLKAIPSLHQELIFGEGTFSEHSIPSPNIINSWLHYSIAIGECIVYYLLCSYNE